MNNPFTSRHRPIGWVLPVSLMTMIVGFMGSTAWINTAQSKDNKIAIDRIGVSPDIANDQVKLVERVKSLEGEVSKLRTENTKFQTLLGNQNGTTKELTNSLRDLKRFASQTEAVGPGVQIVLSDSKKSDAPEISASIIHDIDILKVVNEMWNAGAEAIAIDDRRVGPSTNIRCVGTTVLVDQKKIASPITIRAIGDRKNLMGGLELPGGIIQELRTVDPSMAKLETIQVMRLPAWSGPTTWDFAKVPEDNP